MASGEDAEIALRAKRKKIRYQPTTNRQGRWKKNETNRITRTEDTSKTDEEENLFIVNTYISWLAKNLSFCKPRRHLDLRGEEGIPKNGIWRQREGPLTVPPFGDLTG